VSLGRATPTAGSLQRLGGLVEKGLEAKELTLANLKENSDRLIELNPAPPAAETDMAQRSDAVPLVAPILDYQVPPVELVIDLPEVATDACSAAHGLTEDPTHQHRVRVDLLIRKAALPSVPPIEHAPYPRATAREPDRPVRTYSGSCEADCAGGPRARRAR
jgi:hypothetical protein